MAVGTNNSGFHVEITIIIIVVGYLHQFIVCFYDFSFLKFLDPRFGWFVINQHKMINTCCLHTHMYIHDTVFIAPKQNQFICTCTVECLIKVIRHQELNAFPGRQVKKVLVLNSSVPQVCSDLPAN